MRLKRIAILMRCTLDSQIRVQRICAVVVLAFLFSFTWNPSASAGELEIRQYPTGTIPSYNEDFSFPQGTLKVGASLNLAYHGDQGVQQAEHGMGYGLGGGFRKLIAEGWLAGVRLDVWRMQIWWRNTAGLSGTSTFLLLQPTAEIVRPFFLWGLPMNAVVSAGYEVNTFVNGARTGQGPILLVGLAVPLP